MSSSYLRPASGRKAARLAPGARARYHGGGLVAEKLLILLQVIGVVMALAGLGGLGYCIVQGFRIRGAGLPPDQVRQRLNALIAVNLGSVAFAALGLAVLVAGLVL